ncbi:MAG TPA: hypothetical protein VHT30_04260 [Acidimicrobiales bacterium]|jgi:hypothetical protein|nr:hypothetical protein [Acidimicrobiales bacterium]
MTRFDLGDDDVLLDLLGDALNEADPVPPDAIRMALALASLGDVDAELATLVADTLVDSDVVLFRHDVTMEPLSGPSDRLVSFTTPRLSVDVDLPANSTTLVGLITPPCAVDLELETQAGTESLRSDDLGRFTVDLPPGPCRLRIHALGGTVVTPWITR